MASPMLMLAFANPATVRNKKNGRRRSALAEDRLERRHGGAAEWDCIPLIFNPGNVAGALRGIAAHA